jgi:regulator of protease activity HflC (stomatin/prohibitin superfamily)
MKLRDRLSGFFDRHIFRITVAALVGSFFFLLFADRVVVIIPAGHCGVLWKRFAGGTQVVSTPPRGSAGVSAPAPAGVAFSCGRNVASNLLQGAAADPTYGEGLRLIWPWDVMTIYDLRFQTIDRDVVAVDSGGLRLDMKVTTRFKLNPAHVATLHQQVGPDYVEVMIAPDVGAFARQVVADYSAEQVYGTERQAAQNRILNLMEQNANAIYYDMLDFHDVLLREITLPPLVATSIEEKVRQFHMAKEWEFRLKREEKERERKGIEAEGIEAFQRTVNRGGGISEQYLRWKGIEATLRLAESQNSKIIIIGSGPHGLPLILGGEAAGPARTRPGPAARADVPPEILAARPGDEPSPGAAAPGTGPPAAAAPTTAAPATPPRSGAAIGPVPERPSTPAPSNGTAPGSGDKGPEPKPAPSSAGSGLTGFLSRLLGWGE